MSNIESFRDRTSNPVTSHGPVPVYVSRSIRTDRAQRPQSGGASAKRKRRMINSISLTIPSYFFHRVFSGSSVSNPTASSFAHRSSGIFTFAKSIVCCIRSALLTPQKVVVIET